MPVDSKQRSGDVPMVLMRFRPAWAYISGICEFGRCFFETTFGGPTVAERARLVILEMLENAVKYSIEGPGNEIELVIQGHVDTMEISVSSVPDSAHLARLKADLSNIHALPPEQAYRAAFLRAAAEPDESSRLGLARIRFEGGVELSMQEQEGGRIRITAAGKLWEI